MIKLRRSSSSSIPSLAPGELAWRDSDRSLWIGKADSSGNYQLNALNPVYSDGSDGSITFDGSSTVLGIAPTSSTYTLTRDIYPSSMTVNSGVTVKNSGFRIFCTGSLVNNGSINADGNAATSNTGASVVTGGFWPSSAMKAGANGQTGTGSSSTGVGVAVGGTGGNGGTGTSAGGSGGTATPPGANFGGVPHSLCALYTHDEATSPITQLNLGTGGGGGGGDGTHPGGGGGGPASALIIAAPIIVGSGTLSANGGNGFTPTVGDCGGGGGGGGGYVLIACRYCSITPTANGGAKGSPSGSGTDNATAGSAGYVVVINEV